MANKPLKSIKFPGLSDTYTVPEVDSTLTGSGKAADAKVVGDQLGDLKSALNIVEGAFDATVTDITPSTPTTGKYISYATGQEVDTASGKYYTLSVGSELIGKTLTISGSSWYNMLPYVFVGVSSEIVYPENVDSTSAKQYTGLEFVPDEAGTLYVNVYVSGPNVHVGKIETDEITDAIKVSALPIDDIGDSLTDAISFSPVDLGNLISPKILNGTTGAITNGTNEIQRVTDYISVDPDTWYMITTEANYERGLYAWYDSNQTFISGAIANEGSSYTHLYCERVKSPSNAAYIVIGFIFQNPYPFPALFKGVSTSIYPSKRWAGKTWALIGDSLTASYVYTGAHYYEYISAATGISIANHAVSGEGYTDGFVTQSLQISASDDIVTIFGSGNDASSGLPLGVPSDTGTSTIAGYINTVIDNVYSINPVIQLGIITPTPWKNNMPYDDGWMEDYANLITTICKLRSIPCLDLYHCTGLDTNSTYVQAQAYSRDGGNATHLNEIGQKHIAPRIQTFLETLLIH